MNGGDVKRLNTLEGLLNMSSGLQKYFSTQWILGIHIFAIWAAFLLGIGLGGIVEQVSTPFTIAALVFGVIGMLMYLIWVVLFFKYNSNTEEQGGAIPVELITDEP